jgi:hypothetical protein
MPVVIGTSGWHYRHWRGGPLPVLDAGERLASALHEILRDRRARHAFYRPAEVSTFEGRPRRFQTTSSPPSRPVGT